MKKILLSAALLLVSAIGYCHISEVSLNGKWSLKFFPQPPAAVMTPEEAASIDGTMIEAIVPGNVEIDLERAGLIADPMIGNNIYTLRKWEGYQWCFRTARCGII